ncbi:hypothetical protein [Streptomyces canus]|uniref:hypothetical protein n=1 Tax=Streptomyces canus TaxID=58343 RepID=UPI0036E6FA99
MPSPSPASSQRSFASGVPSSEKVWTAPASAAVPMASLVGGKVVVIFVAEEGPYQGKILSSMVPGAKKMTKWGLW